MKKTILILTALLLLSGLATADNHYTHEELSTWESFTNSISGAMSGMASTVDNTEPEEHSVPTQDEIDSTPPSIDTNTPWYMFSIVQDEANPGDTLTYETSLRFNPDGSTCEEYGDNYPQQYGLWIEGEGYEDPNYAWNSNGEWVTMYCDGTYTDISIDFQAPSNTGTYEYDLVGHLSFSDLLNQGELTVNPDQGVTWQSDEVEIVDPQDDDDGTTDPEEIEVWEQIGSGADAHCTSRTYEEGNEPSSAYYSETACESDLPDLEDANADIQGDNEANVGENVFFDASGSTGEGSLSYQWEVNGESAGSGSSISTSFDEVGSQTVTLTVEDSEGQTDTRNHEIYIDYEGPEAHASSTQTEIELGDTVNLDGSQSSGGTYTIEEYTWRAEGETFTGQRPSHTFEEPGTHTVELEVVDRETNSDTDSLEIEVIETHELSNIKMEAPRHVVLDDTQTLTFVESEATAEAGISQVEWEIGETDYYTGKEIEHQFRTRGDHQVEMTVIDNDGQEVTQNHVITVQEEEPGIVERVVAWFSDLFS